MPLIISDPNPTHILYIKAPIHAPTKQERIDTRTTALTAATTALAPQLAGTPQAWTTPIPTATP